MFRARIPGLICLLVLFAILVAGLAPFERPLNTVTWLEHQNGLHFGRYGTIWSSDTFPVAALRGQPACSLEIWLQPDTTSASSTFLAFSTPENPLQLTLHQYHTSLILDREIRNGQHRTQRIGVRDVFRQIEPVFVTITWGPEKTSIYVNGNLARSVSQIRFGEDCAGELVIGTSPVGQSSWSGQLQGFALYQRELAPAEVLQHFHTWTTQGRLELSGNEQAVAVYLFNERAGNTVHNSLHPGIDLSIPKRFSLLHQLFLEPFWTEFKPGPSYWVDLLINIIGFVPLGFFFCAYWSVVRTIKHPRLTTVVLGLAVSLTIEVLQSYLPTRDSGTTDLITNTLGTFLGVRLYASKAARATRESLLSTLERR